MDLSSFGGTISPDQCCYETKQKLLQEGE